MKSCTAFCRLLAGCSLFALSFAIQSHAQAPAAPNIAGPPVATSDAPSIPELKSKAEAGDAAAQYALGRAYETGKDVPQNDEKAVAWYRKSADQGFAKAQTALGIMYRLGRGLEQDKAEAVRWYKKAAAQKDPAGLFNLAVSYYNGDGVDADEWTAYKLFLVAYDTGSKSAEDPVIRLGAKLPPNEVAVAMYQIAEMYQRGDVFVQNDKDAATWFEKAADRGNAPAKVHLAALLDTGNGVPKDFTRAIILCKEAADSKYALGAVCVGIHYEQGLGVTRNTAEAVKWYTQAAQAYNGTALYLLSHIYWHGDVDVPADKQRAYVFLLLLASAGYRPAARDADALSRELTDKERKRAENRAREWVKQHGSWALKQLVPRRTESFQ